MDKEEFRRQAYALVESECRELDIDTIVFQDDHVSADPSESFATHARTLIEVVDDARKAAG